MLHQLLFEISFNWPCYFTAAPAPFPVTKGIIEIKIGSHIAIYIYMAICYMLYMLQNLKNTKCLLSCSHKMFGDNYEEAFLGKAILIVHEGVVCLILFSH